MAALRFLKSTLALDLRSLALFRMLMGIMVLADAIYRLPDLTNFYTDIGLVPRALFTSEMTMPWSFSFHLSNGTSPFIFIMFMIQLLIGIMLVLGYKSRWAMLLAYLFTVSLHNRNWLINNGGHDVQRVIFFLSIFLPLDRRFSIDSALRKDDDPCEQSHFSTWGLAFFFQVFAIYFVGYLLKDHPMWRREYSAIFFSSRLDIFATPLSIWMRDFPFLQQLLTIFTIFLEWLGPLLLFFSFVFGKRWWICRLITVSLFWGLHIGIILTMWIGIFPYLCIGIWFAFLPGPFWDRVLGYFRKKGMGNLSIYYDGECGFCLKGVKIIKEFFLLPEVMIIEAQSDKSIHAAMLKQNSWVVLNERGGHFFHFNAMLELMRHSPILKYKVWFFSLKPVHWFCHRLYLWVSHHRQSMGKLSQFLEYRSARKKVLTLSWLHGLSGAFILVTLVAWNLTTLKKLNFSAPFFQNVTRWLHLYQEWNMFAPFPKMDNIWIEIPATLSDGSQLEILTGDRDIYSIKADRFPGIVPNEHWRKFYLNLSDRTDYAKYYGGYLCREWNDRKIRKVPGTTLRKMEIIVFGQDNLPNGDRGAVKRKLTWHHWCFDEDYKKDNPVKAP